MAPSMHGGTKARVEEFRPSKKGRRGTGRGGGGGGEGEGGGKGVMSTEVSAKFGFALMRFEPQVK